MKKLLILVILSIVAVSSYLCNAASISGTFDPVLGETVTITSPYPTDESWQQTVNDSMSVHVSNPLNETMNVSFYWSNHTLISYNNSVENDTTVTINSGMTYAHYQQYDWYVNATSSSCDTQSETWWFKGEAFPWDINRDQSINVTDRNLICAVYGSKTYSGREDTNSDSLVNYLDAGLLALHYGE